MATSYGFELENGKGVIELERTGTLEREKYRG
jgi:hypothetical protein